MTNLPFLKYLTPKCLRLEITNELLEIAHEGS